jgi:uncharacterized membrane protein YhaH (DUF805 family)
MEKVFTSIGYNLRRIADPTGRESNPLFWPYAILIAALNYVAGAMAAAPMMIEMMQNMGRVFVDLQRRGARNEPPPLPFDTAFMPDMSAVVVPNAIILAASVVLLFSAVARRLHDRDRTGLWGLLPVPFAALGIALIPYAFGDLVGAPEVPAIFLALMLNNLLYLASLVLLIVLLVGKGTPDANRFGAPPA